MSLDKLKTAWQDDKLPLPPNEEKKMSQITQMIENNVTTMMEGQRQHFFRSLLRMLAVPVIATALFYSMSDGFTNEADPISTWLIMLVGFVPFILFFWSRYRRTGAAMSAPTADVRTQLPKTISFLRRNQRAEVGLTLLIALLAVVSVVVAMVNNVGVVMPMVAALILAGVVTWRTWRRYQSQLVELNGYLTQLNEVEA